MFHHCKTEKEAKDLFRKLALRLHPDYGGDHYHMVLLSEHYEMCLQIIRGVSEIQEEKPEVGRYEKSFQDVPAGDERLKIINEIISYAKDHKSFNIAYTLSIEAYLEEKGYVTSSQYNTLLKTYYAFRMHENEEKE